MSFGIDIVKTLADPLIAINDVAKNLINMHSIKRNGYLIKQEIPFNIDIHSDQKVPNQTSRLIYSFLIEKGLDIKDVILLKNNHSDSEFDWAVGQEPKNLSLFILVIPYQAINRIEIYGELGISKYKFCILHEFGHYALRHALKKSTVIPLKEGLFRLVTYTVSIIAVSFFTKELMGAHLMACAGAKLSGWIFHQSLEREIEYQADEYASTYGNEVIDSGIMFFHDMMKCNGDLPYPILQSHPSIIDRIKRLIQYQKSISASST